MCLSNEPVNFSPSVVDHQSRSIYASIDLRKSYLDLVAKAASVPKAACFIHIGV